VTGTRYVLTNVELPLAKPPGTRWDIATVGDSILSVLPAGAKSYPAESKIDGKNKYLIAGLMDAHVHFERHGGGINDNLSWEYLRHGLTSVFCMSGSHAILDLRNKIAAGRLLGPRIYSTGPIQNDPKLDYRAARRRAQSQAAAGYNAVKVYNLLTDQAFNGFCDGAREAGIPVVGHIVRSVGAAATLESYQSAVVHAEEFVYTTFDFVLREVNNKENAKLKANRLPRLAETAARAGLTLVPTIQAFTAILGQARDVVAWCARPEMSSVPAPMLRQWQPGRNHYARDFNQPYHLDRLQRAYDFILLLVQSFAEAGVKIVAGTDAPIPGVVPGYTLVSELQDYAHCGMSNRSAIETATVRAAEMARDPRIGQITPGSYADLLMLGGNPLRDLEHLRRPAGVMARGDWVAGRTLGEPMPEGSLSASNGSK
jgi:hypothetical protein